MSGPRLESNPWALEFHDVTVSYHQKPVLYGVDCCIRPGSLVGILGPNGAGKSTLLKAAVGLLPLAGGYVEVFGKSFRRNCHLVGYVPQRESVDWDFPVTARDVVLMGRYGKLGLFRRPGKQDRVIADKALEKVEMQAYADRQISQLSGGQQQRVFLARALAQESQLYLMDEPFAGVDAATERAVIGLLRQMREEGRTVLVVHHDLTTAPEYFDHLLLLNLRLICYGPTAEVWNQENLQKAYGGKLTLLSEMAARRQS